MNVESPATGPEAFRSPPSHQDRLAHIEHKLDRVLSRLDTLDSAVIRLFEWLETGLAKDASALAAQLQHSTQALKAAVAANQPSPTTTPAPPM